MRAVRLTGAGRLEPVEAPDPAPGPGEAVLRVAACGICGSDLSCYTTGVFAGSILGHEVAGWVDGLGPEARGWEVGEPAGVDPKIPCGSCADCEAGTAHRCTESLTRAIGAATDGGFAEHLRVPVANLLRLPPGLDVRDACLIEPLAVALHGIERAGGIAPGEPALVLGLGSIGLLAVAALRARGAGPVTGIDPVAARRDLALGLGAARALPPGDEARAAGAGTPLVLECTGRAEAVGEATNLAGAGGRVALLGIPMGEATLTPLVWVARELTITGSIASTRADLEEAARLLVAEPRIPRIVTRRIGLEEVPETVAALARGAEGGKVVVEPDRPGALGE